MNRKYPQLVPNLVVYYQRDFGGVKYSLPVELRSYEIIEGAKETINARLLPGEPCTLREINISDIRRMPANDRPRWVHHYEVKPILAGLPTSVPEDMLRFDNAVPLTFQMIDGGSVLNKGESRYIVGRCAMTKSRTIAFARWESFGWTATLLQTQSFKAQLLQGAHG